MDWKALKRVPGLRRGTKRVEINIKQPTGKHTPQRTCVACRQVKAKRELIRLVCVCDGSVEVDAGGKKPGRGAYLCRAPRCWELGLKTGRLEHTLRTSLNKDNREKLESYGGEILQGVS